MLAAGLIAGTPAWVTECGSRAFADRADRVARSWRPDVVQAELPVMARHALRLGPPAARILVEHDPPTAAGAAVGTPTVFAGHLRRLDARAWRAYERASLPRFDAVVVFTERDRDVVSRLGASRVETIPLAADSSTETIPPSPTVCSAFASTAPTASSSFAEIAATRE